MIGIEAEMSRYLALRGPSQRPIENPLSTANAIDRGTVMMQMIRGEVPNKNAKGMSTTAL